MHCTTQNGVADISGSEPREQQLPWQGWGTLLHQPLTERCRPHRGSLLVQSRNLTGKERKGKWPGRLSTTHSFFDHCPCFLASTLYSVAKHLRSLECCQACSQLRRMKSSSRCDPRMSHCIFQRQEATISTQSLFPTSSCLGCFSVIFFTPELSKRNVCPPSYLW